MEMSNMIMMNPSSSSSSCSFKKSTFSSMMGFAPSSSLFVRNSLKMGGFREKGDLEYCQSSVRIRCGAEKNKVKLEEEELSKKKKKAKKLIKELSRDLSVLYGMGFGLDSEYHQEKQLNHQGLADQVNFKMISEAAELLVEQLKQVRAEDKELKKKMKMEEKKKRKAKQKMESSSSSSSESSDSESENETVVDLNRLKGSLQSVCSVAEVPVVVPSIPTMQEDMDVSLVPSTSGSRGGEEEGVIPGVGIRVNQEDSRVEVELEGMVGKKIEVCMGGKCKKAGGARLMEEFERVVGLNPDIEVCGCKCMGKCKEGPNVRVVNSQSSEGVPVAFAAARGNPLCLGVGVEDVGFIVSNVVGDESHQKGGLGVPAAAI